MNAGQEAYDRLMAARRVVTAEEQAELAKERERQAKDVRVYRKLPRVV